MFRQMNCTPDFALLEVGVEPIGNSAREKLWRRYTLSMEGFECEITEVFDRRIFADVDPDAVTLQPAEPQDTVLVHGIHYPASWIYGNLKRERPESSSFHRSSLPMQSVS
jgi:hypothetical protein